jgi:hypothetical protein
VPDLAGLVGNWTTEGEFAENPFGPAQKYSGRLAGGVCDISS